MSIIDTLIYDRTQADVSLAAQLNGLWGPEGWTGTAAELAQWLAGLRGAYTVADLNRVGGAVAYVAGRLTGAGYIVQVAPKVDWGDGDEPSVGQLADYLADVATLRGVLAVAEGTPEVPGGLDRLTWREANDIERILLDLDLLVTNMSAAYRHAGAAVCGMEGLIR